jgi:Bifunctional DNA primase/polymerase, N-terminal
MQLLALALFPATIDQISGDGQRRSGVPMGPPPAAWRPVTRRASLRRAAVRYAGHGWPVVPGAELVGGRYVCGALCPTVACHPAFAGWERLASVSKSTVEGWWRAGAFSVLLATGLAFDVLELAAWPDEHVLDAARTGPVLRAPTGGAMFLLRTGGPLDPELAARADVVLHGAGSWIAVPPTRTPAGRLRWIVAPQQCSWRLPDPEPLQRRLLTLPAGPGSTHVFARIAAPMRQRPA